jgi:hypothetical protein
VEKIGVVVLGMSRSGTSAVTAALVRSGFFVAGERDLMPPNEGNPAGYFENLRIQLVNERVLKALGGDWFEPPSRTRQVGAMKWAVPTLRAERDRVIRDAADRPVVLKDPRIGVMLPLWGELLATCFEPVLVVRHPAEIAQSLHSRDGTAVADALAAWAAHMRGLAAYLAGGDVVVVSYAQLVAEPALAPAIVGALRERLAPDRAALIEPGRAAGALDPDLHQNRVGVQTGLAGLSDGEAVLWRWLDRLPAGRQRLHPPPAPGRC